MATARLVPTAPVAPPPQMVVLEMTLAEATMLKATMGVDSTVDIRKRIVGFFLHDISGDVRVQRHREVAQQELNKDTYYHIYRVLDNVLP